MEKIILSAIKLNDKSVVVELQPDSRHDNIIHYLAKSGFSTPIKGGQGFLTSRGRFVDRVEAKRVAIQSGQITESEFPQLYSEDLW